MSEAREVRIVWSPTGKVERRIPVGHLSDQEVERLVRVESQALAHGYRVVDTGGDDASGTDGSGDISSLFDDPEAPTW